VPPSPKYARIEHERRFLVQTLPPEAHSARRRRIADRYIVGTTLRLREMTEDGAEPVYKLTQKKEGWITTIYLTSGEFGIFAQLPANHLTKIRYSVPPFGIDVFEGPLSGLILAEAEFDSEIDAGALALPSFLDREVTAEVRYTGGYLASTTAR
jgi:CYTH domain-containing protein